MKRHVAIPFAALSLGIAGAALRGWELAFAFEHDSWFAISGHPASVAVMVFMCVCIVAALVYSVGGSFRRTHGFLDAMAGTRVPFIVGMSAALLLIIAAAAKGFIEFAANGGTPLHNLIFGALAVISGFCVFAVSAGLYKGKVITSAGYCMLTPIFWGCLWLLFTYWVKSADPVLIDYIYELFAVMFVVISFYLTAGFFFGNAYPKRTVFCLLMSVVTGTMNAGGIVAARVFYGRPFGENDLSNILYFGFAIIYCFVFCVVLLRNFAPKKIVVSREF